MTGFDLLGQTYLMCTVFGWGFIVFTLMMGHFGHDGSDGGDGGNGHSIQSDSSGGEAGIGSHAQGVLDAATESITSMAAASTACISPMGIVD
jgi:hypothetical protein